MNWKRLEGRLTERLLDEFASAANPTRTAYEQGLWRTQIALGDWRIETNDASRDARARNVRSGANIQDREDALYFALKAFLAKRERRRAESGIGLVLAGGGAKGAYQTGVWRALRETGLSALITGISGVSIGAINAALFLLGDWREAYQLWMSMSDPDIRRAQRAEIERLTNAYERRRNESPLPPWLLDLMEDSFISQPELERRLLPVIKSIGPDARRNTALYATVTPLEETLLLLPGLLDPRTPPFSDGIADESAHYISWRGLSNMDTMRLLLASSALPIAYSPATFQGKLYYDGGLYDNVPIWPLYQEGFRKFIVVDLKRERERPWRMPSDMERCDFYVVHPGADFPDDFLATFELSPQITRERIRSGYEDALRVLEDFT